ncbi:MAG: TIR domain-containing protein [Clostridia bacterium]|nr:TIR domain-containing protein [Clostridia bacterium]
MRFKFKSYCGEDAFFYILCAEADKAAAAEIANAIAAEGFRVTYDVVDFKEKNEVSNIAERLEGSSAMILLLSEKACAKLFFRDCINMAVEKRIVNAGGEERREERKALFVFLKGFTPSEGLAIQLAKKPTMEYEDTAGLLDRLAGEQMLTQTMKGSVEAAGLPSFGKLLFTLASLALSGGLAFGVYTAVKSRLDTLTVSGLNGAEYVDISKRGTDTLYDLNGMTIGTLYMPDCGIDDITAVGDIDVSVVDISHNSGITSLVPLLKCEHLKKVIISKDMVPLTRVFDGTGIIVEIVP